LFAIVAALSAMFGTPHNSPRFQPQAPMVEPAGIQASMDMTYTN
jgi:hypothetical protein